jgi:hypothetical protein
MKTESCLPLFSLSIALATFTLAVSTDRVYASGCQNSTCTYYYGNGSSTTGSCGTYTGSSGSNCACTKDNNSQQQSACDL